MTLHAHLRKTLGALAVATLLAASGLGLSTGAFSSTVHAAPAGGQHIAAGVWYNANPGTRDITRIVISGYSGQYARTYGACHPYDCDWGWATLYRTGMYTYSGYYSFSFATVRESLLIQGPFLRVITYTHYIDHSGRADQTNIDYMVNPQLSGRWINLDPQTRSISYLYLAFYQNGGTSVSIFGACEPAACAWGAQSTNGQYPRYAHYDFGFAVKSVVLRGDGPYLYTTTYTHFTDGSGRHDYQSDDRYYYAG